MDAFQQRHAFWSLPIAVLRKMQGDQGGSLAALIAHYGFLSVFPLILVFSGVLGFVLGSDPHLKAHILATTEHSFPALSGYVRGPIKGSRLALGTGAFIALWAGLGVTRATERAMNTIWDIPLADRPNLWWSRLRGLAMLAILGTTFLVSTALSSLQQTGGILALPAALLGALGPLLLNFILYLLAFQVLTNRHQTWRSLIPGAVVGAAGWTLLESLGAFYTRHELAHLSQLYGALAGVMGVLLWIYLGGLLTVYAAEVNVVLEQHLWPRSLAGSATTEADRRALLLIARQRDRVAGEVVTVGFATTPGARPVDAAGTDPPAVSREEHRGVDDVVTHLQAFAGYRSRLAVTDDEKERDRLRERLRAEADAAAQSVAELAHDDSVLGEAIGRRFP